MEHPGRFCSLKGQRSETSELSKGAVGREVGILEWTLKAPKWEVGSVSSKLGHYIQLYITKGEGIMRTNLHLIIIASRTSLVVQWLRICLPTHGTWVQFLVQDDSICLGELNRCTTTEPTLWSPWSTTKETTVISPAPQLDKVHMREEKPSTAKNKLKNPTKTNQNYRIQSNAHVRLWNLTVEIHAHLNPDLHQTATSLLISVILNLHSESWGWRYGIWGF